MQEELDNPELLKGWNSEIFQCSYTVYCHIDNLENTYYEEIEAQLKSIEGVEGAISNYRTILTIYNKFGNEGLNTLINEEEGLNILINQIENEI